MDMRLVMGRVIHLISGWLCTPITYLLVVHYRSHYVWVMAGDMHRVMSGLSRALWNGADNALRAV